MSYGGGKLKAYHSKKKLTKLIPFNIALRNCNINCIKAKQEKLQSNLYSIWSLEVFDEHNNCSYRDHTKENDIHSASEVRVPLGTNNK